MTAYTQLWRLFMADLLTKGRVAALAILTGGIVLIAWAVARTSPATKPGTHTNRKQPDHTLRTPNRPADPTLIRPSPRPRSHQDRRRAGVTVTVPGQH